MATLHLLLIDPQNDFCDVPMALYGPNDETPALPVSGAHRDMQQVACLINTLGQRLTGITVSLDAHPELAIERPSVWRDAQGQPVAPFTQITYADVQAGIYVPIAEQALVAQQLKRLDKLGLTLMVWPTHCVKDSWGYQVHPAVNLELKAWEKRTGQIVEYVPKGEYPWSEHYGIFEAVTPLPEVPETQFNLDLAQRLSQVDTLLVAGEASTHCVLHSLTQLMQAADSGGIDFDFTKLVLLEDAMSPIAGFEADWADLLQRLNQRGARRSTVAEWTN